MTDTPQINLKFAKNWKRFLDWHENLSKANPIYIPWTVQSAKIQELFEATVPNILDWKIIWKELDTWLRQMYKEKKQVMWSEQRREIETLMLGQLKSLNQPHFILVYKSNGTPQVNPDTMTYWEALRVKQNLDGDSNGVGGNEDMENINIVNLNRLLN